MNKRICLFLYTLFSNVKIHVQVHYTSALQFYVYVNVKFYTHFHVLEKKGEAR